MAKIKINVSKIDFTPQDGGSYDIEWPGPPRRALVYSDLKHYTPVIELEKKAPIEFTIIFAIKEYKKDIELGLFTAHFNVGQTTPTEIREVNYMPGPPKDVDGSPPYTIGSFWLGIGQQGKLRSNTGTGDDGHGQVCLKTFWWAPKVSGYQLAGQTTSPRHRVSAVDT